MNGLIAKLDEFNHPPVPRAARATGRLALCVLTGRERRKRSPRREPQDIKKFLEK
jgi:hypothetical protein